MNVSVRDGGGIAFAAIAAWIARAVSTSVPHPLRVVVRAGFLDVRDHHDALVGPHAAADLGHERTAGRRLEAGLDDRLSPSRGPP